MCVLCLKVFTSDYTSYNTTQIKEHPRGGTPLQSTDVVLMPGQRRRRWHSIKTTSSQRGTFAGIPCGYFGVVAAMLALQVKNTLVVFRCGWRKAYGACVQTVPRGRCKNIGKWAAGVDTPGESGACSCTFHFDPGVPSLTPVLANTSPRWRPPT